MAHCSPQSRRPRQLPALLGAGSLLAFLIPLAALAQDPLTSLQQPTTGEGPGSLSAQVDPELDQALTEGLQRRFDQIEGLAKIEVEAEAGVVTLRGSVLEESDRHDAVAMARRVEGVAHVVDRIDVVVDPLQRLEPAMNKGLERLRTLVSYTPLLAVSLVIALLFYWLGRWIGSLDALYARFSPNRFAQDLLRRTVRVAVLLIGVLLGLELLDATALVGAVLGTAGVVGLAVGFAFRDLVENYIASILLSLRQPFAPTDFVSIDGQEGKVIRLTSRATILMTMDGNHLRIPNSQVFKGVILNYSRNPQRRFDFGVGVGVGEDLAEARRLGIEAMQHMPGILDDPEPMALIEALGDSSVLIRFYAWVDQQSASFLKVKSEAIRHVKTVLEDAGMDLPEPIYRLHMVESLPKEPKEPKDMPKQSTAAGVSKEPAVTATSADDIALDTHIERQIGQERAEAGAEEDLLNASAPTE